MKIREGKFRVYDKNTIEKMERLLGTGEYRTQNDLYQEVLKQGVEKEYGKVFNFEITQKKNIAAAEPKTEEMMKAINFMKMSVDEMFVSMNIIKHLVTTLYNIKLAELDGEHVDRFLIETGGLSIMPEDLKEIEDSLLAKHRRERNRQ